MEKIIHFLKWFWSKHQAQTKALNWLQELTDSANKAQGLDAVNGIAVSKSVELFNFTQVHNVAQGKQVTPSVLVLLVLDSSDQDLAVF